MHGNWTLSYGRNQFLALNLREMIKGTLSRDPLCFVAHPKSNTQRALTHQWDKCWPLSGPFRFTHSSRQHISHATLPSPTNLTCNAVLDTVPGSATSSSSLPWTRPPPAALYLFQELVLASSLFSALRTAPPCLPLLSPLPEAAALNLFLCSFFLLPLLQQRTAGSYN